MGARNTHNVYLLGTTVRFRALALLLLCGDRPSFFSVIHVILRGRPKMGRIAGGPLWSAVAPWSWPAPVQQRVLPPPSLSAGFY